MVVEGLERSDLVPIDVESRMVPEEGPHRLHWRKELEAAELPQALRTLVNGGDRLGRID